MCCRSLTNEVVLASVHVCDSCVVELGSELSPLQDRGRRDGGISVFRGASRCCTVCGGFLSQDRSAASRGGASRGEPLTPANVVRKFSPTLRHLRSMRRISELESLHITSGVNLYQQRHSLTICA